jgi:iron(III) transport system substrate-binding protein
MFGYIVKWASQTSGVAAALLLLATASAQAADSARLNQILEAAKKEGRLSIVHSQGSMGGPNSGLREAFNKHYGTNIDVEFTPAPSMNEFIQQIIQQVQSGRTPVTDILVGYALHMYLALKANAIQVGDWKSWAPNLKKGESVSPDGAAVRLQTTIPGIAYNTNAFKGREAPRTLRDLLRADLKGHVAATPYAAYFDVVGSDELWGREKVIAFAKELSPNLGGLIRCNEITRVASGEFDAFGLTCDQTGTLSVAAKGGPVAWVPAKDAPMLQYLYQAVPTNAAHPNAAKLWINFMTSREAQDLLYKVELADSDAIEGSKTAETVRAMKSEGAKLLAIDVDFYRTHEGANLPAIQAEAVKILRMR